MLDWWDELIGSTAVGIGQSNAELKKWYRKLNAKFFNGDLPDNVLLQWATPEQEPDIASCEPRSDGTNCYKLLFNRLKNPTKTLLLSAMLHEMVHIATKYKDNHGPAFDAWHKKLTKRGAFKKGAVLKDVTLF